MGILSIETRASGPVNVDGWAQFRKLALEKQGVEGIQEVRLNTQDQSIECVGGDEFKSDAKVLKMPLPSLVLDCVAPGELWIEFMGQRGGLQTFAGIVSSIRRRP